MEIEIIQLKSENPEFIEIVPLSTNSMELTGESPGSSKIVTVWTEGETRLLLDMYATHLAEVGPMKKFKTKKEMWAKISQELEGKTAKQCEERYKTVMKRKKAAVENNSSTGAKRQKVLFEEEINKICQLDDSIEPAIKLSSQEVARKEQKELKEKKRKRNTLQETLKEIAEKKEEAREKRHKERMERADKMERLLEKLLTENKSA